MHSVPGRGLCTEETIYNVCGGKGLHTGDTIYNGLAMEFKVAEQDDYIMATWHTDMQNVGSTTADSQLKCSLRVL